MPNDKKDSKINNYKMIEALKSNNSKEQNKKKSNIIQSLIKNKTIKIGSGEPAIRLVLKKTIRQKTKG